MSYEDAPFGIFVRFGGGRGGFWFRYKGHVRYVPRATLKRLATESMEFFRRASNFHCVWKRISGCWSWYWGARLVLL